MFEMKIWRHLDREIMVVDLVSSYMSTAAEIAY